MLCAKTFEVRDSGTFIPAVGILCEIPDTLRLLDDPTAPNEADCFLLGRAGYRRTRCVLFMRLDGDSIAPYDEYKWPAHNRTMRIAHGHVIQHWDELKSGDVIDVEWILGLSAAPKKSESRSFL